MNGKASATQGPDKEQITIAGTTHEGLTKAVNLPGCFMDTLAELSAIVSDHTE